MNLCELFHEKLSSCTAADSCSVTSSIFPSPGLLACSFLLAFCCEFDFSFALGRYSECCPQAHLYLCLLPLDSFIALQIDFISPPLNHIRTYQQLFPFREDGCYDFVLH